MAAKQTAVIDERTVEKIAAVVENFSQCQRLSQALLIDGDIVENLRSQRCDVASVVVVIVECWLKQNGDQASGEALPAALENSLGDTAHQFRKELIGRRKWTYNSFDSVQNH